jgi:hypothetical protein
MTINWLGTTAIALVIGSGVVIAQSQPDLPQNREESPRAQAPSLPSKEADRPAAGERQPADRPKNRAARPEPKAGAKEPHRGEAPSSPERKQAQEPTPPRDAKQGQEKQGQERQSQDRQSQDRQSQPKQNQEMRREEPPGRGKRAPAGSAQRENQQSGRDAERPAEPKQQLGRDRQPKQDTQRQDNQAPDAKQPADAKQQQDQRQRERNDQGRDRNDQAAQPSTVPPAQQGARPGDTQAPDQTARRGTTSSATINDQQRTQIVERLRRDRAASNQNINIQVNIGQRLPPRVRTRPLPPEIVRIAPQYRGYQYAVVEDEVVIVHPRTHEVVDVIREPGSAVETTSHVQRERVVLAREQRETLKQAARRMTTAPVSGSPSASTPDSGCLALQPVPEELVRANPELSSYRYLTIGDQVVLVDPREQKIVEVID